MRLALLVVLAVSALARVQTQDASGALYGYGPRPAAAPAPQYFPRHSQPQGVLYSQAAQYASAPGGGGFEESPASPFFLGGGAPGGASAATGPITFGPEHARPAVPPPNPFRQGPLVQAALQQQLVSQQQQQQQQAFATASSSSPSSRYVSIQQQQLQQQLQLQQPVEAEAQVDPSQYGAYSASAPSGPAPSSFVSY